MSANAPPGPDLPVLTVSGAVLSCTEVESVAERRLRAELGPEVLDRVRRGAAYADEVASTRAVYGRSTGVGANREVAVTTDPREHALGLLRSHATSAGVLRSPERVRAMLLVRLNQLAADGNGIDPAVVESLAGMLAADALPPVREWVGIGTGDLSALGTTALALLGEIPCTAALPATTTFGPGDALAFLSSNAAALGDAALAVAALTRLADASLVVAALTWTAVGGNDEAFAEAVEVATPFTGAVRVCRTLRALTQAPDAPAPARIQDPFGLRTLPQVQGALVDALARAEHVVSVMGAAPSENPALLRSHGVAHHGAFHAAYLTQALDALVLATAQAGQTGLNRLTMLAEPGLTGDRAFLAEDTPGASGTMVVEYVAAAALGDLRALAQPAGLQTVTVSRGLEDGASYASLAARQALGALAPVRTLLAAELLCASRAIGPAGRVPPALVPVMDAVARATPLRDERADRDLSADLDALTAMVDDLAASVAGEVRGA